MVDLSDKGSSESEEMQTQTPDRVSSEGDQIKTCADCGTTKTPLWRGGPAGPKSLCNACGIRSRKRRRALLGLNKDEKKSKKNIGNKSSGSSSSSGGGVGGRLGDSLKKRLIEIGREVAFQRPRSKSTATVIGKQRMKLGEEEQAAILLMALSCGSVYA